jgi:hypothetical protein
MQAQFSGGSGTNADPYIVTTAEHLATLAQYVNAGNKSFNDKCYKVGNDISLAQAWTPIGSNSAHAFKGVFDGNGKKITGLLINITTFGANIGLFGYIDGGTVKNLGVENANITVLTGNSEGQSSGAGGIAGTLDGGVISNCYFTGTINAMDNLTAYSAGGVAGRLYNNSSVSNCYTAGSVTGAFTGAGASKPMAGGIVGHLNGNSVSNCYSVMSVSVLANNNQGSAGGIAGDVMYGSSVLVLNCAALNPGISCSAGSTFFGRVAMSYGGAIMTNIAFADMLNPAGGTSWNNIGATNIDGESVSKSQINGDGTLGGRFLTANGWTTQNGKLPGLFGNIVDMPAHLVSVGIEDNIAPRQTLTAWTQNGILHISGLAAGEQWSVYTIAGTLVAESAKAERREGANVISIKLPYRGIYIVKSGNKQLKIEN